MASQVAGVRLVRAGICAVLANAFRWTRRPSAHLLLPYPAPPHARHYEEVLRSPVEFDASVMQWQFDATMLAQALPNADELAERLHLSPRTLHRRLADTGTGYQEILDGIRSRLAVEFLERTGLSVEQIAERSGFSDVSNFRKVFKKWTGQSPAYYRNNKGRQRWPGTENGYSG